MRERNTGLLWNGGRNERLKSFLSARESQLSVLPQELERPLGQFVEMRQIPSRCWKEARQGE